VRAPRWRLLFYPLIYAVAAYGEAEYYIWRIRQRLHP
jgi:hypothetical protein